MIIYALIGSATVSIYLLSFLYKETSIVFNQSHSTALLSLMFVTAIVGCTSSILFMPYMRNYREIYLVSYLVGEGLSGFIPSIAALIQGNGSAECVNVTLPGSSELKFELQETDPRFSTSVFFIFHGVLLTGTFVSFICLNKLTVAKGERVKPIEGSESLRTDVNAPANYKTRTGYVMPKSTYCYLLTMMAVICFLSNGALPSIQPFSCGPYGTLAYHLTITLVSMIQPLAMCLGFFIKNYKVSILTNLMIVSLMLAGFVMYLALGSTDPPPLHTSTWGTVMVVIVWVAVAGIMSFIRMAITSIFRLDPGKGLYYTGVVTQLGSFLGAVVFFLLVTFTSTFQKSSFGQATPCDKS